eukprot:3744725-Pyramimonas_sp.AAC.1
MQTKKCTNQTVALHFKGGLKDQMRRAALRYGRDTEEGEPSFSGGGQQPNRRRVVEASRPIGSNGGGQQTYRRRVPTNGGSQQTNRK